MTENMRGQAIEKSHLNSIKERVWKKHRFTAVRRYRKMQEVAPPTTYDIYM